MKKRTIICLILVLAALISALFVGDIASSASTYRDLYTSLDGKAESVLKLTAATTVTSTIVSAVPDDTATPIAEKLSDLTIYLMGVLAIIYAEKYMLTIIGLIVWRAVVPVCLLIAALGVGLRSRTARDIAVRVLAFSLAVFLAVPVGVGVSDMISDANEESLTAAIEEAESFNEENSGGLLSTITNAVTGVVNKAATIVNHTIQNVAVMIVADCVAPLLIAAFILKIAKYAMQFPAAPAANYFPLPAPGKLPQEAEPAPLPADRG